MIRNTLVVVGSILLLVGVSSAQSGLRILGAQQLMLDDNNPAHVKTFLSPSNGSLGIDNTGAITVGTFPNPCALLDLNSTTMGFLPPRMTLAQELAMCGGTPPEGMVVYNTTTHTLDVYGGTFWGAAGWALNGNNLSGGSSATPSQYFGSNNNFDVIMKTNGTERLRINAAGNIYVNTTTGTGLLNLTRTLSLVGGGILQDNEVIVSPGAAASGQYDGLMANMQYTSGNAMNGALLGTFSTVQSSPTSTGAINQMAGVVGNVGNYSSAAITRADAFYGQIQSQNLAGTMTDGSNFRATTFISAPQTVTNVRGLYVNNPLVTGTLTNNFGIDIDQLTSGINNTAFRYNHATQPVTISGAGDVQIGGLATGFSAGLMVSRTSTATSGGAKVASEAQLVVAPTAPTFVQYIGNYSHVDAANTVSLAGAFLYGLWGGAELYPTATSPIGNARGIIAELFYQTSQPLGDGAAINATADIEGTGSATNVSVYRATFQNNAASSIGNLKLINVLDLFSNAGTITNTYGLYIGDLTIGTQTNKPYSIFAVDANTRSFVDGKFGFGSFNGVGPTPASDPQTTVDIAGSIAIRNTNLSYAWGGGAVILNTAAQEGYITVNPTGAGAIIGINNPADGRVMIVHKAAGSAQLVFTNEDAGEPTAANRIHCMSGANVTINGEALITFIYEGSLGVNRWLIQSISQF